MTTDNIEKSGFHRGQYVGYAGWKVYRITKTNSSYGNWIARNQDDANDFIYAHRLAQLSAIFRNMASELRSV